MRNKLFKNKKRAIILVVSITILLAGIFGYNFFYILYQKNINNMEYIPSGSFIIGSNNSEEDLVGIDIGSRGSVFYKNEIPERKIFLKDFFIDKYEVSNEDYKSFINKNNHSPPTNWENGTFEAGKEKHPVNNISWYDSQEYCKWLNKRLPYEEEWEKAARGTDGNRYPWGNKFNINNANFNKGDTTPTGYIKKDKSYYGIFDMAGNLMEWTSSWYKKYPGSTYESEDFGKKYKVVKGATGMKLGHYKLSGRFSRSSQRLFFQPTGKAISLGFRCAKDGID